MRVIAKQRVLGFSSAGSLLGKKNSISSPCWFLIWLQGVRASLSGLQIYSSFLFVNFYEVKGHDFFIFCHEML